MQKFTGCLVAVILIAVLLCGVVAAGFSVTSDGSVFTWGDTIRFSGIADTNMTAGTDGVYIFLKDQNGIESPRSGMDCTGLRFDSESPIIIPSGGQWSYSWNSRESTCNYPSKDMTITIQSYQISGGKIDVSSNKQFPITIKAVVTPTPSPTPDYQAQIAALQTQVSAQATQIKAHGTQIQEIAVRTPVPTTIIPTTVPTTVITTKTPVPTQTPDYEATLAAIQKQIDQQNDIIYQILHFLGLK